MKRRKILAVTGIRSEYYILYPVLKVLKDDGFIVSLVVSGAHLSPWHGETCKEIEKDGFNIVDKIDTLFMTNRNTQRIKSVGILCYALSQVVEREKPDFLLVVGDREESIGTALVGNYMDVLTAHIGGGDPVFGNADDPIRFAVSKLAHLHFVTAEEYAENLKKIGEEDFRISWVGNPIYTSISWVKEISLKELSEYLEFDIADGRFGIIINHPLSSEFQNSYFQMKVVMEACSKFARENMLKFVGVYPNTDPGSYDILKAIDESAEKKLIKFYKNFEREIFVNLMREARVLVGNSSMGILEAPFYKLPVVNIGNRQKGRLNAGNVEFVGYDINDIYNKIYTAAFDENCRQKISNIKNPFGDENNAYRIVNVLNKIDTNNRKWYIKKKLC